MPSGERLPGRIAISAHQPDPDPDLPNDPTWACWLLAEPIRGGPIKICGAGSMQPLVLALQFLGYVLHDFVERGGHVTSPDEPGSFRVLSMFRVLMWRPFDPTPPDPVLAELDDEIAEEQRRH
jgi:hypothetical protein